jgi:acyl-CoA thioesterase
MTQPPRPATSLDSITPRPATRAQELLARDLVCQDLDIRVDGATPGGAVLRMTLTDRMVNGHGIVHGGYIFLLADSAFACASNSYGPVCVAQGAQITFLRPAIAGEELTAEAVERTRLGRDGLYDVTVRRPDGTVVAEFRGHSLLVTGSLTG